MKIWKSNCFHLHSKMCKPENCAPDVRLSAPDQHQPHNLSQPDVRKMEACFDSKGSFGSLLINLSMAYDCLSRYLEYP